MRLPSTRLAVVCTWLATVAFMAGFLVFIVRPWTWHRDQELDNPRPTHPRAQGLQHGAGGGEVTGRRGRRRRPLTPEARLQRRERRRRRLLRDQAEYRQWRREVRGGEAEQRDLVEEAVEELWHELFDESLDFGDIIDGEDREQSLTV